MLKLYAKAFMSSLSRGKTPAPPITLTDYCHELETSIEREHCQRYNRLTHWRPYSAIVHPNYIQTLSLEMQLSMMVRPDFVFSPMGLVHIGNEIKISQLPEQSDRLVLKTVFGHIFKHRRGWLFELRTLAYVSDELAVEATSYYLSKDNKQANLKTKKISEDIADMSNDDQSKHESGASHFKTPSWISHPHDRLSKDTGSWSDVRSVTLPFKSNSGRAYARISSDYNPIHLLPITARIFGFRRAIAHGMFSKALALSNMAEELDYFYKDAQIRCLFQQPNFLPTNCNLCVKVGQFDSAAVQMSSSEKENQRHASSNEPVLTSKRRDFTLTSEQRKKTRSHIQGSVVC